MKGIIFDIKRFSIHDGPGIRTTVFFKGCPLHCLWCHNPEGIDSRLELMPHPGRCAEDCFDCLQACPDGPLSKTNGRVTVDRARCDEKSCLRCADACLYDALSVVGRRVSVAELIGEIEKDRVFYEQSGGGVTFSGGEPLEQHRFLETLLDELRGRLYRTAVDTSGLASFHVLEKIARKTDLILYDLKIMDEIKHEEYTGVSNGIILDNLKKLSGVGREIWIRLPLISGVNDDDDNIRRMAEFLRALKNIHRVSILPYHKGGCEKYKNLGKESEFREFDPPSPSRLTEVEGILAKSGLPVKRGG